MATAQPGREFPWCAHIFELVHRVGAFDASEDGHLVIDRAFTSRWDEGEHPPKYTFALLVHQALVWPRQVATTKCKEIMAGLHEATGFRLQLIVLSCILGRPAFRVAETFP